MEAGTLGHLQTIASKTVELYKLELKIFSVFLNIAYSPLILGFSVVALFKS